MKQLLLCTTGGMPAAQKPVVTALRASTLFYRACVLDMERSHLPPNSTVPLCARRRQSRWLTWIHPTRVLLQVKTTPAPLHHVNVIDGMCLCHQHFREPGFTVKKHQKKVWFAQPWRPPVKAYYNSRDGEVCVWSDGCAAVRAEDGSAAHRWAAGGRRSTHLTVKSSPGTTGKSGERRRNAGQRLVSLLCLAVISVKFTWPAAYLPLEQHEKRMECLRAKPPLSPVSLWTCVAFGQVYSCPAVHRLVPPRPDTRNVRHAWTQKRPNGNSLRAHSEAGLNTNAALVPLLPDLETVCSCALVFFRHTPEPRNSSYGICDWQSCPTLTLEPRQPRLLTHGDWPTQVAKAPWGCASASLHLSCKAKSE